MKMLNCKNCNKIFSQSSRHKKYCSNKCFLEAKNKAHKLWITKPNKKGLKDDKGRILSNKEVRLLERRGEKNKEYNDKYFSTKKGKKTRSDYLNKYRKINLKYKIALRMRGRIKDFMKIKNITKKNKTFDYVGCTPEFLKLYLEKKFYNHPITNEPMTWENHSLNGWHIDHIIPLDKAKNEDDAKKLCHYKNLQPMWSKENWKKNKY